MEGRTTYFAYGSNLDPEGMKYHAPEAVKLSGAVLRDYRLAFRGVADIERADGQSVLGGLWSVTDRDIIGLDRYEGVPQFYHQIRVPVFALMADGNAGCLPIENVMTYQIVHPRPESTPSPGYLGCIRDGYEFFGIDLNSLERSAA